MINMTNVSARQAESYYQADDYYTTNHPPSQWLGSGAEALGLRGQVKAEDFSKMLRGQLPNGESIPEAKNGERRAGTDITFSAPKSVSIMALVADDQRIIKAHHDAVAAALKHAEAVVQSRITEAGATRTETTGQAAFAVFQHDTTRAGDPDLHSHAVMVNATRTADGRWRAIENRELYRLQRDLDLHYKSELAVRLHEMGYELRATKHGFEIAQVSQAAIDEFSQRSQAVEAYLADKGYTRDDAPPEVLRAAGQETRDAKKHYDRAELKASHHSRGTAVGLDGTRPLRGLELDPDRAAATRAAGAREAAEWAQRHLGEREQSWQRKDLERAAMGGGWGKATFDEVRTSLIAAEARGELIQRADGSYTTIAAQMRETKIIGIERAGRGAVQPIMSIAAVAAALEKTKLNQGQRDAVTIGLSTSNRIVGVQGLAGTGKTTMLAELRQLAEAQGYKLVGVAPSHSAVKAMREAGIEAQTLQKWVADGKAAPDARTLVIVDEASLASAKLLEAAIERIERGDARALVVGDRGQYQSVEAGRVFAQLQDAGMATATMDEMQRQRHATVATREAAELAAKGHTRAAVETLAAAGAVREIEDRSARHQQIAEDYTRMSVEQRADALILTGSNADRHAINEAVRRELGLDGQGREVQTWTDSRATRAELERAEAYKLGDAVRWTSRDRDNRMRAGDVAVIKSNVGGMVKLETLDGTKEITLSPAQLAERGVQVGQLETRELAVGDRI